MTEITDESLAKFLTAHYELFKAAYDLLGATPDRMSASAKRLSTACDAAQIAHRGAIADAADKVLPPKAA